MNTELLKLGKYSEQKIVDTFGTNAQKKSFQEKGKLTGSYKTKLLETAARYCKITELPNRYYVISEIYKYPIPKQFTQMNRSLYKYITPLLLYHLINGHDADNAITLTVGKWAREIKMINHNYTLIKNNKEQTHEEYGSPKNPIKYYSHFRLVNFSNVYLVFLQLNPLVILQHNIYILM